MNRFPVRRVRKRMSALIVPVSGEGTSQVPAKGAKHFFIAIRFYYLNARYRKVMICPLVQGFSGAKVVLVTPVVTPFDTAQATACA